MGCSLTLAGTLLFGVFTVITYAPTFAQIAHAEMNGVLPPRLSM